MLKKLKYKLKKLIYFNSIDSTINWLAYKQARRFQIYNQFEIANLLMQPLLSQQFLNQYVLLNNEDRQISMKANKYILEAIKHPQILENALQMTLNRSNSVKLQMLGAHLIYIKIQNDFCKMELHEFLPLKQLIQARLYDNSFEKGAENIFCSIMGILVTILYPQNWDKFIQQIVNFMRSDINRFNYGLTILQRVAAELKNQSITRSLRIKTMKAFHEESAQLLQVFQFIIELNNSDFNSKLIAVLDQWSSVNLPLLKNKFIIDFVLTQVISDGSVIRLGTLSIIKNALKRAFYGKKQKYDLSLNFEECNLTEEERQSLNKITNFLIRQNIWFYQSLQLYQQDQDLENYIQIINTLLLSYSFLLLTPRGEEILQLPQFLFKSSFKKISHSTFNLWCSFYSLMQKYKNHAKKLHLDELANQMLLDLLKKVALTKEQIRQEINQNDQTRNFGEMGFFQYREEATLLFKAIHDFFLHYAQNQEAGTQKFINILLKHLNGIQESIWVQLFFLIAQNCFGRGLDESDYQTLKVLKILKQVFQYCGEQKQRIHQLAVTRVLTTIKDYRFQLSQDIQLYIQALKFSMMYLTSENNGHNSALAFDRLLQISKQEIRRGIIQEVADFYLKQDFKSIRVKSKVLSAIIRLNKNSQDLQQQLCIFQKIIVKIEKNLQIIHKVYMLESLPNPQPYQIFMTEISILCKSIKLIDHHSQNFQSLQKKIAQLSVNVINQAIQYGLNYQQSFYNYKTLLNCIKNFQKVVSILPKSMILWIYPQTVVLLLERVFLLFQIKNLNLLLDHGKLVVIAANLLKILSGKSIYQVDLWLKQNVLRINQFFSNYYQLKCNPNFKETDPDIIRAYFTLEESFCIYKFQVFLQQIPETILQFAIQCLEKIIEKKLQKQVLSFMLNYLQRKKMQQNVCEVAIWLSKNLILLSPILDSSCQNLLASLIINLSVHMPHNVLTQVINQTMNNPNFDFVNAQMKTLVAQYLPFFATKGSLDKTKAIFNHLNEVKCQEIRNDEYAESFSMIYRKWLKTLLNIVQNQEDFIHVYSDIESD